MIAVTTGGPSVVVQGWIAVIIIIGGLGAAFLTIWKVLWPLLRATVEIAEQMPFLKQAQEKHDQLTTRVDNHELRINALEHR